MEQDELDDWIEKALESDPLPFIEVDDSPSQRGPPLAEDEIVSAHANLSTWQSPADLIVATQTLCDRCRSKEFFNNPRLKFLHDAYVLAELVRLVQFDNVRLADKREQWPDGFGKLSNRIHNIEITSTHGGRKLGEEYRTVSKPELDPVENWTARADSIPTFLDEAIRLKVQKKYSTSFWLVVYLNINEFDIRHVETEQTILEIKGRYREVVPRLSVLWKGKIY